jgi:proteasome lid subunit RPN8/RPN11
MAREHVERIGAQGRATYPSECCGFLLGTWSPDGKQVKDVRPVENARTDSPHNR